MLEETAKELSKFGRETIKQAKSNLTRGLNRKYSMNASKKLYNSLKFQSKVNPNSIEIAFYMEDYGAYQDEGVHGTEKRYQKKLIYKRNSTEGFKFSNEKPPSSAFDKWRVRKGLAPRTKGGQFTNRKDGNYALSNYIFKYGIKPSLFFTTPFERNFKKLPDELIEAYGLDLERILQGNINQK